MAMSFLGGNLQLEILIQKSVILKSFGVDLASHMHLVSSQPIRVRVQRPKHTHKTDIRDSINSWLRSSIIAVGKTQS